MNYSQTQGNIFRLVEPFRFCNSGWGLVYGQEGQGCYDSSSSMGHMITARNPVVQEQDEAAEDGCWMPAAGGSRGEPGSASTLARLTAPSAEMPSGEQLFVLYLSPSGNFESGAQWCQQEAEILPCYQTEIREEEKVIESKREHRLRSGLKLGRLTHLLIQWLFIELLCANFRSGDSAVGNEDEVLAFLRWRSNMGGKDIICQTLDNALKKKKSISTTLKI